MPDDQPEKLTLGGNGYNATTGNFELKVSSRWGTATAAENARFEIAATMVITDPNGAVDTVAGVSPVRRAASSTPGTTEVPLEDALVAWDRRGGTYSGTVSVATTASLTKNGNPVAHSQATRTDSIVVGDSRTDPGPG